MRITDGTDSGGNHADLQDHRCHVWKSTVGECSLYASLCSVNFYKAQDGHYSHFTQRLTTFGVGTEPGNIHDIIQICES